MRKRPTPEEYVMQDVQAQGTEVRNFQRDTIARLTLLEHATALSRCHQTRAPDLTVCCYGHMVCTYYFPLCVHYTVVLICTEIGLPRFPETVCLRKSCGRSLARVCSSLIFSGFRISVVSFHLTASGGERLAYCVAFGLFPTLTQFSGKVGFTWLGRFGVACVRREVDSEVSRPASYTRAAICVRRLTL